MLHNYALYLQTMQLLLWSPPCSVSHMGKESYDNAQQGNECVIFLLGLCACETFLFLVPFSIVALPSSP